MFWLALFLHVEAHELQQRQIAALIAKLGANEFAVRQDAARCLLRIGGPCIPQLERATTDGDPERQRRSVRLLEDIYASYFPQDFHKLPGIVYLSIYKFVDGGEASIDKARVWATKQGISKENVRFGSGFGLDSVATKEYLREKVRHGASREEIAKLVEHMKKNRRRLRLPIENDPDYVLVKDLMKR